MAKKFRVFATCNIGDAALNLLRQRGYDLEVYPQPTAPPKSLIIEKVKSGIDGLITTLRDAIEYKMPFPPPADVLTEATAEFAFFMLGTLARKMWPAEHLTRDNQWDYWHPFLPFLGDEVTGKTVAVIGTGRIGLAFIKKCSGFDMNILCYDPAYENHAFVKTIQEIN